ncbi:MAG: transporter [Chthoniobacterales bacterium]
MIRARSTACFAVLVTCHLSLITLFSAEPLAKGIQDNSFLVEEAYNQEPGVVQHILNVPVFVTHGQKAVCPSFTQEWPIFSQTHQFSYTLPYTFTEEANGFEDVWLNYRLQALMEAECVPAFAPRFSFILPTGDADEGFGHERLGYEINLPFSKIVADRWTIHFNAGGSIFPDVRGHDPTNYNWGASAIFAVSRDFNLMLESIVVSEEDVDEMNDTHRATAALISPGVRYAFNLPGDAQLVVGLAVPIGLTSDSPDYGVFFYCSFEHLFAASGQP